jgi:hypothetical protein
MSAGPRRSANADMSTERLLRLGLAALAVIGTVGLVVELVLLRHWKGGGQVVGWVGVVALVLGVIAVRSLGSPRGVQAVRMLAGIALLVGLLGMALHVHANYEWGPADSVYGPSWETTALPVRLFLAATDTIGKAPAVAPGALSFVALTLLLATVRLPVRAAADERPPASRPPAEPEPPTTPAAS